MIRFKLLSSPLEDHLESLLNGWVATLPAGAKIRRTQLSAVHVPATGKTIPRTMLFALVNYELPEEPKP